MHDISVYKQRINWHEYYSKIKAEFITGFMPEALLFLCVMKHILRKLNKRKIILIKDIQIFTQG